MSEIEEMSRNDLILENIKLSQDKNQLEKELEDIRLELSTPSTSGLDKEPLYKWAALIVCEGHQLRKEISRMRTNAENTIREILGDNAPDIIVDPVYSLLVMALVLQAKTELLKAKLKKHRWIFVTDMPKEYIKPSPSHPVNWTKIYLVLEYDDSIPRPMTAENIWLNEGSEVQWYKPIILPEQALKDGVTK